MTYLAIRLFVIPDFGGCVTIKKNTQFVILNKVKNLMILANCSAEILRLKPQNDIVTQPLRSGIQGLALKILFLLHITGFLFPDYYLRGQVSQE
jgi:hypothetical protein